LADFGFTIPEGESVVGGTLHYLPNEQQEGQPARKASDIYSAACSMFEVLIKKKFSMKSKQGVNFNFEDIWDQNLKGNTYFHRKRCNPHATQLFEVLKNCLDADYTKRMTAKQVVDKISQTYQDYSATLLQKQYRGYHTRKSYPRSRKTIKK